MLIPAVLNLPSAISPLWSRNAVSLHSYFPLKPLCWAELFLIALICCILGWEKLVQSDNCSLSPRIAAALLPTGVHPPPSNPCSLPTAHQAVVQTGSGCSPDQPVWPVCTCREANHITGLTQWHQTPCSQARIFPSTWLTFIHGLKGERESFGQSDGAQCPGRTAQPWFSYQHARWSKPARTGMGQCQANKARGTQKGETREEEGDSEEFEGLCLCICLDLLQLVFSEVPQITWALHLALAYQRGC